jgi:hypothetical protein
VKPGSLAICRKKEVLLGLFPLSQMKRGAIVSNMLPLAGLRSVGVAEQQLLKIKGRKIFATEDKVFSEVLAKPGKF